MKQRKYLIYHKETPMGFYLELGFGITADKSKAARFTRKQAEKIVAQNPDTHEMRPITKKRWAA